MFEKVVRQTIDMVVDDENAKDDTVIVRILATIVR